METRFLAIIPVIPSADIARDCQWYEEKTGFKTHYADTMYAVLYRENLCLHLQWHADTADDPLLGGSVIRLHVQDIKPIFEEFVKRGTILKEKFRANTAWRTNEFGFYDLNQNAVFVMEDIA